MPKFNLSEKFNFQGLDIAYRVVATNPKNVNGSVFILDLQSLSFGSKALHHHVDQYRQWQKTENLPDAFFIFVDYPGSGKSSKSLEPNKRYTIDFFTQVIAAVLEEVKRSLQVPKMELIIRASSDASLVAMNLIAYKREWVKSDSAIEIKLITHLSGLVNGTSPVEYVREHCKDDPNLGDYLRALQRLDRGEFRDSKDVIKQYHAKLAPLLLDTQSLEFRTLIKFTLKHPDLVYHFISFLNFLPLTKNLHAYLEYGKEVLRGCNVDVANHFNKTQYQQFDVEKLVSDNLALFSNVTIVYIDASDDKITPAELHSQRVKALLPQVICIEVNGKANSIQAKADILYRSLYSLCSTKHPIACESTTACVFKKLNIHEPSPVLTQSSVLAKSDKGKKSVTFALVPEYSSTMGLRK